MAGEIDGSNRALIHEKDDLAARVGQRGPVPGQNCLIQRLVVAAHIVGCDELPGGKD